MEGLDDLGPRSRRPHSSPHGTSDEVRDRIVRLRSSSPRAALTQALRPSRGTSSGRAGPSRRPRPSGASSTPPISSYPSRASARAAPGSGSRPRRPTRSGSPTSPSGAWPTGARAAGRPPLPPQGRRGPCPTTRPRHRRRARGHGRRPRHRRDPLDPPDRARQGLLAQHTTRPRPMAGVSADPLITRVADDATHVSPMSRLKTMARPEGFEPRLLIRSWYRATSDPVFHVPSSAVGYVNYPQDGWPWG